MLLGAPLSACVWGGWWQTGRGANAWSKKRKHCDRWSSDETDKFYLGLRKFGSDFTIIAHWLGDRRDDRRHVRNKFKKEEKVNPLRIQRFVARAHYYSIYYSV